MNLKSIFRRNNYVYLYNLLKPFPKSVRKRHISNVSYNNIQAIVDYLELSEYEELVVVACGPTSRNIRFSNKSIYLCTNRAIRLMGSFPFIYMVTDPFCLVDYIKSYNPPANWKGSFFWYYSSEKKQKKAEVKLLRKYLTSYSRSKREFLITNLKEDNILNEVHYEITNFLKEKLGINFFGVNSGFQILVLGYVMAYYSNIPIKIYGLDLGENEEAYFYKKTELGKTIKSDFTKKIVGEFLEKIYKEDKIDVQNFSFFFPTPKTE